MANTRPRLGDYDYGDTFNQNDVRAMKNQGYSRRQIAKYRSKGGPGNVKAKDMSGGQRMQSGRGLPKNVIESIEDYNARGVAGKGKGKNQYKKAGWTAQDVAYLRKHGGFNDNQIAKKMQADMDTGNFRMGKKAKAFMGGDHSFGWGQGGRKNKGPGGGGSGGGGGGGGGTAPVDPTTGGGGTLPLIGNDNTIDSHNKDIDVTDAFKNTAKTDVKAVQGSHNKTHWEDNSNTEIGSNNTNELSLENVGNVSTNQSLNQNVTGSNNVMLNTAGGNTGGSIDLSGFGSQSFKEIDLRKEMAQTYSNDYKAQIKNDLFSKGIFS